MSITDCGVLPFAPQSRRRWVRPADRACRRPPIGPRPYELPGRVAPTKMSVPHVAPGHDRERLDPDLGPGMGGVDHHGAAGLDPDVEADVGHVARARPEEHQVTRLEHRALRQRGRGVELILRHPWQGDAGHPVGGLHQAGAVEADAGASRHPRCRACRPAPGPRRRRWPPRWRRWRQAGATSPKVCGQGRAPRRRRRRHGCRRRRRPARRRLRRRHWHTASGRRHRRRRPGRTGWAG